MYIGYTDTHSYKIKIPTSLKIFLYYFNSIILYLKFILPEIYNENYI